MPSKPSCSASTACASRSSGGKCSWEAWKKYRVVAMASDYPRARLAEAATSGRC